MSIMKYQNKGSPTEKLDKTNKITMKIEIFVIRFVIRKNAVAAHTNEEKRAVYQKSGFEITGGVTGEHLEWNPDRIGPLLLP